MTIAPPDAPSSLVLDETATLSGADAAFLKCSATSHSAGDSPAGMWQLATDEHGSAPSNEISWNAPPSASSVSVKTQSDGPTSDDYMPYHESSPTKHDEIASGEENYNESSYSTCSSIDAEAMQRSFEEEITNAVRSQLSSPALLTEEKSALQTSVDQNVLSPTAEAGGEPECKVDRHIKGEVEMNCDTSNSRGAEAETEKFASPGSSTELEHMPSCIALETALSFQTSSNIDDLKAWLASWVRTPHWNHGHMTELSHGPVLVQKICTESSEPTNAKHHCYLLYLDYCRGICGQFAPQDRGNPLELLQTVFGYLDIAYTNQDVPYDYQGTFSMTKKPTDRLAAGQGLAFAANAIAGNPFWIPCYISLSAPDPDGQLAP